MFSLAKELGMTVSDLCQKLTVEEMTGWVAYFSVKAEKEEKERDKVQRGAASRLQSR